MQITANFDVILRNATFWQFFELFGWLKDFFGKIKKIWNI
jgi:hypothetical protein